MPHYNDAHLRVQWCKHHRVIWLDELSFTIFLTIGQVHVWRTSRGEYRPEGLTPTVRLSVGSVMPWGAFCRHALGLTVPLEQRVTANQYNIFLSDHLYPIMKHFYPGGSCTALNTFVIKTPNEEISFYLCITLALISLKRVGFCSLCSFWHFKLASFLSPVGCHLEECCSSLQ